MYQMDFVFCWSFFQYFLWNTDYFSFRQHVSISLFLFYCNYLEYQINAMFKFNKFDVLIYLPSNKESVSASSYSSSVFSLLFTDVISLICTLFSIFGLSTQVSRFVLLPFCFSLLKEGLQNRNYYELVALKILSTFSVIIKVTKSTQWNIIRRNISM